MLNLQEPCRVVIKESEIVDNADEICKDRYVKWIEGKLDGATAEVGLSSTRSIDSKVLKELKKMGLDKKFQNAMDRGLAPRREGTSGIIKLTENEIEYKGGYEYIYKVKVPKAGGHTRVYGRINESGELIFDLILKK